MKDDSKNSATSIELKKGPSIWTFLAGGLRIALIGAAGLALVESVAAVGIVLKHFDDGWPWYLIVSVLGKFAVSHSLFWCPLMLVIAGVFWLFVKKKAHSTAGPFLFAALIILADFIVIPADLELAHRGGRAFVTAVQIGGVVLGIAAYVISRGVARKIAEKKQNRYLRIVTALAVLIIVIGGIAFVHSPFYNPGAYKIPPLSPVASSRARPNVLWIVFDTVRADNLSCYGNSEGTAPFLAEWADKSAVFDRAIGNSMWTLPAHVSMFTGLTERQHGASHDNPRLDDGFPTVADILARNGYKTASFSGNPWISRESNAAKGFETCVVTYHIRHIGKFSLEYLAEKWGITPFLPWLNLDFSAAINSYFAGEWLEENAEGDAPFFLFINYMEAHMPYLSPKRYRSLYLSTEEVDRSYDLRYAVHGNLVPAINTRFNVEGGEFLAVPDREILKGQYKAAIRYLDDRVRELIAVLDQCNVLDNTLVIIASDHGEYLGTHSMWGHRMQVYEDLIHVALMVRAPGVDEGKRISTPVQLYDLYPTVLNAALGTDSPEWDYGPRDLLREIGHDEAGRIAISQSQGPCESVRNAIREHKDPAATHRVQPQTAAQDGHFKYIASADGVRELYDLHSDPGELNNLFGSHEAEAERLSRYIEKWQDSVPLYDLSKADGAPALDPKHIEALRSLGYVE